MAHHGYMSIVGKHQGLISAGCSSLDSIGNRCQSAHLDKILVLSFSHNLSNVDNTQYATHRPIVLIKHVDKATPLLAQALARRERVNCEFDFYRTSRSGNQERYFSIQLWGGVIVDQRMEMPHSVLFNDQDSQEQLAISYTDINWTHHIAATTGGASWTNSPWIE
ncbi:Hcp family type VI secretion system effector [Pseudomonas sp. B21-012]|uniref:Hcp family type VI secretion system effector n=1 Tax=Pseudomonas sp. B21-012 TaxID=2895472 RepID=UPI00215E4557|nr:Hcp family type VI secretion system effector [Pseudomonas sp. B21-012]UVM53944.1 Hcp family type VI secretion system effector [Pseudomonas sp. B21-012]